MKRVIPALILALTLAVIPISAMESTAPPNANGAPVAENLELTTYRGVAVSGRLSAIDPEGDPLAYTVTTEPRKGRINMTVDGRFVYTPLEGKKGKDYFGFKACDSAGNYSQEATVIIKIEKQATTVSYADIKGRGVEYTALALAERDILVGERVGGSYVFEPRRQVSRGEFLAMCLKLTGAEVLSGVTRTGFADDDDIPAWVKPYVSTALLKGVISGYSGNGTATFDATAAITFSEAAVVLSRVLELSDVASASRMPAGDVPAWAYQAAVNLSACRILSDVSSMSDCVTREDAAVMLMNAAAVLERRK